MFDWLASFWIQLIGFFRNLSNTQHELILMMGQQGTRKTVTFNQIGQFSYQRDEEFQELKIQNNYYLVDCPSINFDDIDQREAFIEKFQKYLEIEEKKNSRVQMIMLCVNFERTDIMKKKVMKIFSFFQKFQLRIIIAVTDFQLSDDQDQTELKEKFQLFFNKSRASSIDDRLIFISRSSPAQKLKDRIVASVQQLKQEGNFEFSIEGTIFEKLDEAEAAKILKNFKFAA